ncbi:MAG: energy transducer TonB [Vulcanimicrobiaceae bacterium]|jgi:hypothetical protein
MRAVNHRVVAALMLPLVLLTSGLAGAHDAPAPATATADRVFALAGTWSCRTAVGSQTTAVGTRSGDAVDVTISVQPASGDQYVVQDHFAYERAQQIWHVDTATGLPFEGSGVGAAWTGSVWRVLLHGPNGPTLMTYETLANGDQRRSFARPTQAGSDHWTAYSTSLCRPGKVPPPADVCIVADAPAATLAAVPPRLQDVPNRTTGVVNVRVYLNTDSQITNATIYSSTSALLNRAALASARASTFQTAIVHCHPIAADYLFTVTFR